MFDKLIEMSIISDRFGHIDILNCNQIYKLSETKFVKSILIIGTKNHAQFSPGSKSTEYTCNINAVQRVRFM